ncbi:HD-GYP domain-containing protein [Heyndrickxia oleronia]|jgi:HD-GYP domain-containing protein (c-di-GMP phosphodiesterase class II)|uniref:HD-GYP domain-containing protein n=1 Tax=Heyndrickxia oleronia TaxID=38875 RepID=UPI00242F9964|nr:HD domain-containing phosphohydrolase [Heyndrickxia oleronia]MCI1592851.1 HD domain-containing protein [Heyndrickxia oleronia]MCI1615655.1 HD domain-containing protein [Heyndrickxia oleronia]MCI1744258.1 HD domain-containing protein [Heyndrickxia oleronia]MCI1763976.1 HD domain-containing protein [Heyndrickxia oleronia]
MKVTIEDLRVGAVLAEDVMGMTGQPIIPKKTIITPEHIEVLKAFLKTDVIIEGLTRKHDQKKNDERVYDTKEEKKIIYSSFREDFEIAVTKYKIDFQKWQSGSAVDIANVRDFLYKLLEKAEEKNISISSQSFSTNQNNYIYDHSVAVGIISGLIAKKMGYDKGHYYQTALAGCLANVGMAKISPKILTKSGVLTSEENKEIQDHPNLSLKMIQNSPLLKPETKLAVFQHHERLDGSGYPMGIKGNQFYPISRIVAVADVFHALISNRSHKKNIAPLKAIEMMKIDEFGKYDISVLNTLSLMAAKLSIGTRVRLSNGEIGVVLFTKQHALTRPLIKLNNGESIDLEKMRELYIEEVYS